MFSAPDWRRIGVTCCSTARYGQFRRILCRPGEDVSTARRWRHSPNNHYTTGRVCDNRAATIATSLDRCHPIDHQTRCQQSFGFAAQGPARSKFFALLTRHTTTIHPIPASGVRRGWVLLCSRAVESLFFYEDTHRIPTDPGNTRGGSLRESFMTQARHEVIPLGAAGSLRLQRAIQAAGTAMILLCPRLCMPIFANVRAATFSTWNCYHDLMIC